MPDIDSTDAVSRAYSLLGEILKDSGGGDIYATAGVRDGLNTLIDAGDIDSLMAQRLDLKKLIRSIFNWAPRANPKATGTVVKACANAMMSKDDQENSLYPHAVEMISYAAAIAPLLEPDRVAAVITEVANTKTAYAPILYTATTTATLKRLISHYPIKRQEQLLVSLWQTSHDGRWWNATAKPSGRKWKKNRTEAIADWVDGGEEGVTGVTDHTLFQQYLASELGYSEHARTRLANMKLSKTQVEQIRRVNHTSGDPDVNLLTSAFHGLEPSQRSENPIPLMLETLEIKLAGESVKTHLPAKPNAWAELYPESSLEAYPIPKELLAWDDCTLPGLEAATIKVLRNESELRGNADYMGNCTAGWDSRSKNGKDFITLVRMDTFAINVEFRYANGNWTLGQVETRVLARQGPVPIEINQALNRLVGRLNNA